MFFLKLEVWTVNCIKFMSDCKFSAYLSGLKGIFYKSSPLLIVLYIDMLWHWKLFHQDFKKCLYGCCEDCESYPREFINIRDFQITLWRNGCKVLCSPLSHGGSHVASRTVKENMLNDKIQDDCFVMNVAYLADFFSEVDSMNFSLQGNMECCTRLVRKQHSKVKFNFT